MKTTKEYYEDYIQATIEGDWQKTQAIALELSSRTDCGSRFLLNMLNTDVTSSVKEIFGFQNPCQ